MADQILKDKNGRTLGRIVSSSPTVLILRDAQGRTKGTYDTKTNKTRDAKGGIVGTGNLLTTLL